MLFSCGSVERANVAGPAAPAPAPIPPPSAALPSRPLNAAVAEVIPEPRVEAQPTPPSPLPMIDARPVGIDDCAAPEKAELLVIASDISSGQGTTLEPDEVPQGGDQLSTLFLSRSGCAVKREPGVWVNAGGKLWQLKTKPMTVRTSACSVTDDDQRAAGEGSAERVELVTAGGRQVVANPPRQVGENEYTESTTFVAAVAETLYFKSTTYAFFCGAHGATVSRFFAHDLLGRKGRYFAESLTDETQLLLAASKRFTSDLPSSRPFKFKTTLPYYAEGVLGFVAQLTAGSTHTESDGLSDPYEHSVFLRTEWMGVGFVKFQQPPPALAAAVVERKFQVFGWSKL